MFKTVAIAIFLMLILFVGNTFSLTIENATFVIFKQVEDCLGDYEFIGGEIVHCWRDDVCDCQIITDGDIKEGIVISTDQGGWILQGPVGNVTYQTIGHNPPVTIIDDAAGLEFSSCHYVRIVTCPQVPALVNTSVSLEGVVVNSNNIFQVFFPIY
jgi:hypothetical protein